jgi:toxin CcdB
LNPVFEVEGRSVVMVTQGMAAVPVQMLKQPVMSLDERRAEIVAALDLLFQGF